MGSTQQTKERKHDRLRYRVISHLDSRHRRRIHDNQPNHHHLDTQRGQKMTIEELLTAIERVRELHKPTEIRGVTDKVLAYEYVGCMECYEHTPKGDRTFVVSMVEYPCPTIRALDGEQ
jgi:hypothetical protein